MDLEAALTDWMDHDEVGRVRPQVVQSALMRARALPQRRTRRWPGGPQSPLRPRWIGWASGAAVAAVVLLVVVVLAPDLRTGEPTGGFIATTVPGEPAAAITLGTGRHASGVTGVATTFPAREPIEGHLLREVAFGFSPVAVRLFRLDAVEGPLLVWSDLYAVEDQQADLDFTVVGQEPAMYRLLAYRAMTEPMASIDLEVVGDATQAPPSPPPVPEGWHLVASDKGDVRMYLPPDLQLGDTSGAIVANEPPDADGGMRQVMAEGPNSDHPQPRAGESLVAWLKGRWLQEGTPVDSTIARSVRLPAGDAIHLIAYVAGGTEHEWWIHLYAIRTPDGVGFLVIDGPPSSWDRQDAADELIPQLIEFGPGAP